MRRFWIVDLLALTLIVALLLLIYREEITNPFAEHAVHRKLGPVSSRASHLFLSLGPPIAAGVTGFTAWLFWSRRTAIGRNLTRYHHPPLPRQREG